MTGSTNHLDRLSSICAPIVRFSVPESELQKIQLYGTIGEQVAKFLVKVNGFYALESALHFFPASTNGEALSIFDWNADNLWRNAYEGRADDLFFFAEDAFGGQFCIQDGAISTFDPETGETKRCCESLLEWADLMLGEEGNFYTGFSLAHSWQVVNGPLDAGRRLVPKRPFVCGGSFEIGNLYNIDSVQGMLYRAELARKIANAPDGTIVPINLF